jgi:hypothetical protein
MPDPDLGQILTAIVTPFDAHDDDVPAPISASLSPARQA